MEAHVICCNDTIMYAVINDAIKASVKMNELKCKEIDDRTRNYRTEDRIKVIEDYENINYWHIHTVEAD